MTISHSERQQKTLSVHIALMLGTPKDYIATTADAAQLLVEAIYWTNSRVFGECTLLTNNKNIYIIKTGLIVSELPFNFTAYIVLYK